MNKKVNGKSTLSIQEAIEKATNFPREILDRSIDLDINSQLTEESKLELKDYLDQYTMMLEMSLVMVGLDLASANFLKIEEIKGAIRAGMRVMEDSLRMTGNDELEEVE